MQLATGIAINEFISAREDEIKAMEKNLKESNQFKGPHVPWQRLPRFMRRRAASHNPKRLPRKMRSFAMNSQAAQDAKKPNNNRRKRRKNSEFGRRQIDKKWMETHVWHAKRMKMEVMWGYKIPLTPNLKSTKALYRANSHYATIYDASYFASIFLIGSFKDISEFLNQFIDPLNQIESPVQGSRMIFSEFPVEKIGPVSFIWNQDKCWLSIHPSISAVVIDLFMKNSQERVKVEICEEYARFELTGPQSLQILKESLELVHHKESWNNLQVFPSNGAIELTVFDPRLSYPKKKIKNKPAIIDIDTRIESQGDSDLSIWKVDKLKEIEGSKISEAILNERRSKNLIPGTPLRPESQDSRIPILILQRSKSVPSKIGLSKSCTTVSEGLDVVVHRAWAREFWRALIYGGAKAQGLNERRSSYFESGIPSFPFDYPETNAFHDLAATVENEEQEAYNRRPSSKKMNFEKIGIKSPFKIPFDNITNSSKLVVLDQPQILAELAKFIDTENFANLVQPAVSFIDHIISVIPKMSNYLNSEYMNSLAVRVRLLTLGKGAPQNRAIIYSTSEERYQFWSKTDNSDVSIDDSNHPLLDDFPDNAETIGYVTTGGFSYTLGNGASIGILSLSKILQIYQFSAIKKRKHRNFVVFRNITGRIAWPAIFEITQDISMN